MMVACGQAGPQAMVLNDATVARMKPKARLRASATHYGEIRESLPRTALARHAGDKAID
jgi:hypothetical protein